MTDTDDQDDPDELAPGELIVDGTQRYRVVSLLGRGGLGVVYKVQHENLGPSALRACKVLRVPHRLSPEEQQRVWQALLVEGRIAAQFEHDNIVKVLAVGRDRTRAKRQVYYLMMELLEGETLAERIATRGKLSLSELCEIMLPVMDGVAQLHRMKTTHRDLKPSNIFLARRPDGSARPKLLDFGISHTLSTEFSRSLGQGPAVGTPGYMGAPQLRGETPSPRFDVHALGVIMYQALSGARPYGTGSSLVSVLDALAQPPVPLTKRCPSLHPSLWKLVERAICEGPNQIETVDELRRGLIAARDRASRSTRTSMLMALTLLAAIIAATQYFADSHTSDAMLAEHETPAPTEAEQRGEQPVRAPVEPPVERMLDFDVPERPTKDSEPPPVPKQRQMRPRSDGATRRAEKNRMPRRDPNAAVDKRDPFELSPLSPEMR